MFPSVNDADIQELLDACSISSFGRNDQLVTDTNYRSSVKLDTDHFVTSFQLANTPIQLAGCTVKFNWSSPPYNPSKTASWAVFFSDVEHEVLWDTLTFNLYAKTCETKAIEACYTPALIHSTSN